MVRDVLNKPEWRTHRFAFVIFFLALFTYWPSLDNGFVWDAEITFLENPQIQSFSSLIEGVMSPSTGQISTIYQGEGTSGLSYFRPVTQFVHFLEYSLFGKEPFGYKLVSLLLHAIVSLLVFYFFLSIQQDQRLAILAAAIYCVKPTHAEAVAWSYSVSYLLTALFSLSALLFYRCQRHGMALIFFLFALLSHEYGILLLPILIIHRVLLEPGNRLGHYRALVPYFLLVLVFLYLRSLMVGGVPMPSMDLFSFINTAVVIVKEYLIMFFWPEAPVTIYLAKIYDQLTLEVFYSYLLTIALMVLTWSLWNRSDRRPLFWFLWFFIWFGVSMNIGQFGDYLIAEKLLYFSSMGLSMLMVIYLQMWLKTRGKVVVSIVVLLTGIQIGLTWQRLPYWKDTATYLKQGLIFAPEYAIARYALADTFIKQERYDEALAELIITIQHKPDFSLAYNNIANIYYLKGELTDALNNWRSAVQYDATNPMPYYNIGMTLERMGKRAEAKRNYLLYLDLATNAPPALVQRIHRM